MTDRLGSAVYDCLVMFVFVVLAMFPFLALFAHAQPQFWPETWLEIAAPSVPLPVIAGVVLVIGLALTVHLWPAPFSQWWSLALATYALGFLPSVIPPLSGQWLQNLSVPVMATSVVQLILLSLMPLLLLFARREPVAIVAARTSFIVLGLLLSAVCLAQYILWNTGHAAASAILDGGSSPYHAVRDTGGPGALRLSGPFQSPNTTAHVLVMTWPFVYYCTSSLWRIPATLVIIWALMATQSRGAMVGLAVQMSILAFLLISRSRLLDKARTIVVLLLVLTGVLLAYVSAPQTVQRIASMTDFGDGSISHRLQIWWQAIQLLLDRPLSGIGHGTFATLYNRYFKIQATDFEFSNTHSTVVQLFCELGLLGSVLFLAGLTFGGRIRRILAPNNLPVGIALAGTVVAAVFTPIAGVPSVAWPFYLLLILAISAIAPQNPSLLFSSRRLHQWKPPNSVRAQLLVTVLLICIAWQATRPFPKHSEWVHSRLAEPLNRAGIQYQYSALDVQSGALYQTPNANKAWPSASVGKIALAASSILESQRNPLFESKPMPLGKSDLVGSGFLQRLTTTTSTLAPADALYLALGPSDTLAANTLLDAVSSGTIYADTIAITGLPILFKDAYGYSNTPLDSRKSIVELFNDASLDEKSLFDGPRMTTYQALQLLHFIVESTAPLARSAATGLELASNNHASVRYLGREKAQLFHKSGTTSLLRHDTLYVKRYNGNDFGIAIFTKDRRYLPKNVDHPAWLAIAESTRRFSVITNQPNPMP